MRQMYGVCCGLDVHKKEITAALLKAEEEAADVKVFGTTTDALKKWLIG